MIRRRKCFYKTTAIAFVVVFLLGLYKINHFLQYELPDNSEKEKTGVGLFMYSANSDESGQNDGLPPLKCQKKKHFVFIKTMKCATETMGNILRRFALRQNLSVLLPNENNIYLGWPYQMEKQDYRPSDSLEGINKYDCLMEHSIYNGTVMKPLFPLDTVYITFIREPWKHFLSTFHYFAVEKIANIPPATPIITYLNNLDKYDEYYKSGNASKYRYCIPNGFSVTKNLLSHCLGMPLGFPEGSKNIISDMKQVHMYLNLLSKDFHLIMIVDYFAESLVLFKRMMCWSIKEILFKKVNSASYSYTFSPKEKDIHRKWSNLDYLLFEHFNKTFWRKISEEPPDFFEEVGIFKNIQSRIDHFCSTNADRKNETRKSIVFSKSQFNEEFVFKRDDCADLDGQFLQELRTAHDKNMKSRFPNGERITSKVKRNC